MSFFNEVEYEAKKTLPDGVEVIVKAKASATSSISFEDAWLKAQELAKKDAEAKLAELIKKIEEKDKTLEVIIKGMKGDIGYPGCKGRTGPMGPTGPAGKDLKNITKYNTTPLTLSQEAAGVVNDLITSSKGPVIPDPFPKSTLGELTTLITALDDLYNDFYVDERWALGDALKLKVDANLTGDKSTLLSQFFIANKGKLLTGIADGTIVLKRIPVTIIIIILDYEFKSAIIDKIKN